MIAIQIPIHTKYNIYFNIKICVWRVWCIDQRAYGFISFRFSHLVSSSNCNFFCVLLLLMFLLLLLFFIVSFQQPLPGFLHHLSPFFPHFVSHFSYKSGVWWFSFSRFVFTISTYFAICYMRSNEYRVRIVSMRSNRRFKFNAVWIDQTRAQCIIKFPLENGSTIDLDSTWQQIFRYVIKIAK